MGNNKKNVKTKKKVDKVTLSVLSSVIVLLLAINIFVNKYSYYDTRSFSIDYLKFTANNYEKSKDTLNLISNENNSCHIKYSSNISNDDDLVQYGEKEKINAYDWVKQEFENGVTWISHYKNSYYIIQMYGDDTKTYNNECKDEFEEIKNTFSFMKNE